MKYGVSKQVLLITAGLIWIIVGVNLFIIGATTWADSTQAWVFKAGETIIIFLLFFVFVFKKLYHKYTRRIEQRKEKKNCPFSFFDVQGWIIMAFMIAFGRTIRTFHLLPNSFISVFYTGLSIALILTGILFLRYWWIKRKTTLA